MTNSAEKKLVRVIAENKKLRARMEELEEKPDYPFEEITRLQQVEEDAIHAEGVAIALREGYTEALARVEELESELGYAEEQLEGSEQ